MSARPAGREVGLALMSIMLVSACLRPAITSVGPLLDDIGQDTGLSSLRLGLLGALPLVMFAVLSPFSGLLGRLRGAEVALAGALVGLLGGSLLRSTAGLVGLWLGTALIGAAVAVANVLTPGLVKRDFGRPALATAMFTTVLSGAAAIASGSSVPIAEVLGGWRPGLVVWALLPAVVLPLWWVRMARTGGTDKTEVIDRGALRVVMRSPVAWQVATFFGLQSLIFYTLVTWLPTVEQSFGASPTTAGLHLLVFQLVGLPMGLAVGFLMERRADQRVAAISVSVPVAVAMVGLAVEPGWALLWVTVGSTGTGSSLAVALALVLHRTEQAAHTTALSGMAQSVGYLIACTGPIAAGEIASRVGWRAVLLVLAGVAITQTVVSLWAARSSTIADPLPTYEPVGPISVAVESVEGRTTVTRQPRSRWSGRCVVRHRSDHDE